MLSITTVCTLNKDLFIKVKNETFQLLTEHCCYNGGKIAMALIIDGKKISKEIKGDLEIVLVEKLDQVLEVALVK